VKWDWSLSVSECSECTVHSVPNLLCVLATFTTRTTLYDMSRFWILVRTKHQPTNHRNDHSGLWPTHARTQFSASLSIPDSQGPERYDLICCSLLFLLGCPSKRSLCSIYVILKLRVEISITVCILIRWCMVISSRADTLSHVNVIMHISSLFSRKVEQFCGQ